MAITTDKLSVEAEIADTMVTRLNADTAELDQPEIHIERPTHWERKLKDMDEGHIYLDVFPIGITQRAKNRRADLYEYETHLVARARPDTSASTSISQEWLDTLQWYRDYAQSVFSVASNKRLSLPTNAINVHRNLSQPFVLQSMAALYGKGLFVAPIQLTWLTIRR